MAIALQSICSFAFESINKKIKKREKRKRKINKELERLLLEFVKAMQSRKTGEQIRIREGKIKVVKFKNVKFKVVKFKVVKFKDVKIKEVKIK